MDRLTDCAQGYCEMYCKKYGHCFGDPGDCIFKDEVKMYEKLKSIEGIIKFDRLLELAVSDKAGQIIILPCKDGSCTQAFAAVTDNNSLSDDLINWVGADGQERHRWIPVKERLPENIGLYLVIENHWLDGSPGIKIAKWNTAGWFTADRKSREITPRVTHWMPLPEPPKEDAT